MIWKRHPVILGGRDTHYANYSALINDCTTIRTVWVRWCGHPTATYKYFIRGIPALEGQTFRTSKDAKTAVEYRTSDGE